MCLNHLSKHHHILSGLLIISLSIEFQILIKKTNKLIYLYFDTFSPNYNKNYLLLLSKID